MLERLNSKYLKLFLLVALIVLSLTLILFNNLHLKKVNNELEIVFLNVGVGSGTLIKTKNNKKILVDAGNDKVFFKSLEKEIGFFDKKIDFIIASHADLDHIGNFVDVLKNYKVEKYIYNGAQRTKKSTFNEIFKILNNKKIDKEILTEGDVIKLSENLKLKFFSPPDISNPEEFDPNTASLVLQLIYKNNNGESLKIMLTGDLPQNIEKFLVAKYGRELKSDILLAGHHGSKTSSSFEFINTVLPEYVVISTAKDNSYGHPNLDVIERFQQVGSKILYTFSDGGKNIKFKISEKGLLVK